MEIFNTDRKDRIASCKRAYAIALPYVQKALREAKKYRIEGYAKNRDNTRFVQIFDRRTGRPVFRLEMHPIPDPDYGYQRIEYLHYHLGGNHAHFTIWPEVKVIY